MIIASGRGIAGIGDAAEAAHIGDQLPDLIVGDFSAVGRHSVGPAIDDAPEDDFGLAAVNPEIVHQGRADAPTAVSMAADAIEGREKLLALTNRVCVLVEAVLRGWRLGAAARMQIAH